MRFVDSAERRGLIIDNNVAGLFSQVKNNDYIFYYEDDGGWIEADVVRGGFLRGKRYKALRRATVMECETLADSLSLADHTPILDRSPVTISYQLNNLNRSGLLSMSRDALDSRILAMVLNVLRAPVSRRTFQQLADQQYDILDQANTRLTDQVQHGFTLHIETMNLRTAMGGAVGDETMKHYRHAQTLIRRMNEELTLIDLRQRHQLSDLMVDKLRNSHRLDLIQQLLQMPPHSLPTAVAMLDPAAARLLLTHAQAQAQIGLNGAAMAGLLNLLSRQVQPAASSGAFAQPTLPGGPQPQPAIGWPQQQPAADPAVQAYLQLGYHACQRIGDDIRLLYGPIRVVLITDGRRVRAVMWGENDPPTNRWTGPMQGQPEAMARLIIEWLRQNL
jgi:hypothetical protein